MSSLVWRIKLVRSQIASVFGGRGVRRLIVDKNKEELGKKEDRIEKREMVIR